MDLLRKIRVINTELQKNIDIKDIFKKLPELVHHLIEANIYIFSRQGNLLGSASSRQTEHDLVRVMINNQGAPVAFIQSEGSFKESTGIPDEYKNLMKNNSAVVIPIICGMERYGSIFMNRPEEPFRDEDRILVEYVASFVGLKLHHNQVKRREVEARSRAKAQKAIHSLTHSELEAIELILQELGGKDGLLVASEAAKKFGISRSIIIVALRKLKSAGIIESHSLGVKGTYIKILNEKILDEIYGDSAQVAY